MYILYFNKSERKIKVSKAHKSLLNLNYTEKVTQYNDCYFYCSERKPLKEKAKEIKQNWIDELEEGLLLTKEIKI
jgi:hypothetical protein